MNRSTNYDTITGSGPHVPFSTVFQPVDAIAESIYQAVAFVAGAVARTIGSINRAIAHRQTVRALSRLDDHMLRDIGINRSQIMSVSRKVNGY